MAIENSYTIDALKKCAEFEGYKDLVGALFASQEKATKQEVRQAIEKYLNREVD